MSGWFFEAHCYGGPFRYWKAIDRAAKNYLTDVGIDAPGWDPAALVVPVIASAAPDNGVIPDGRAQHAMHSSPEGLYATKRGERRTLTVRR